MDRSSAFIVKDVKPRIELVLRLSVTGFTGRKTMFVCLEVNLISFFSRWVFLHTRKTRSIKITSNLQNKRGGTETVDSELHLVASPSADGAAELS